MQSAAAPDGHETIEVAERRRRRQHLHSRVVNPPGQLSCVAGGIAGEHRPAQLGAIVHQHHVGPPVGCPERGRHTGEAASDHQHVRMAAAVLGVPLAVCLLLRQLAESSRVTQDLLVQRPQTPGADEGLVVEARRREPATDEISPPHQVELERRAGVHVPDLHPGAHGLGAGANAGPAIDLDQAVRAIARAAEKPAGPVVLEAARYDPPARRVERGADRVALEGLDSFPVELEPDRAIAVDSLVGPGRKSVAHSGSPTQLTWFVVVSRSATNQARQPDRWYHHSRWRPARLLRK